MKESTRIRRPLRRLILTTGLAASLLGALAPQCAGAIPLRGLRGEALGDAELAHGNAVIVVWASWSPRGRDIAERASALAKRWGGTARFLTVNFQEDAATVEHFLAAHPMAAPVYLDADGTFSKKYAVATLPGLIVLKEGAPAFHGRLPEDADRAISEALR